MLYIYGNRFHPKMLGSTSSHQKKNNNNNNNNNKKQRKTRQNKTTTINHPSIEQNILVVFPQIR